MIKKHERAAWQLGYDLAAKGQPKSRCTTQWMLAGWHDYQIEHETGVFS